jgi:hypothetical protein
MVVTLAKVKGVTLGELADHIGTHRNSLTEKVARRRPLFVGYLADCPPVVLGTVAGDQRQLPVPAGVRLDERRRCARDGTRVAAQQRHPCAT